MNSLYIREFLSKFSDDLRLLNEQFNFYKNRECYLQPWLILDEYLSGKFPDGFYKGELERLKNRVKEFENIVYVLPDYKSDFKDLLSEIYYLSNNYIKSYEFISSSLEKEIAIKEKELELTIDRNDFLQNNQYKKLFDISKLIDSIFAKTKFYDNCGIKGFNCNLHPDIVKEIFKSMVTSKQISDNLTDFMAIFSKDSIPVENPVKWLILHNGKPNKTALFTFIKLMLELDELPREILRQANNLFISGKENIFPVKYSYPSLEEQKSSIVTHFKPVKELIKKNRPA